MLRLGGNPGRRVGIIWPRRYVRRAGRWLAQRTAQTRKLLRLLLLDPNGEAAKALAVWLRRWGFEVNVCHSAEESLEQLDSLAPHVIVVVTEGLDVDACDLAAALRACSSRVAAARSTGSARSRTSRLLSG